MSKLWKEKEIRVRSIVEMIMSREIQTYSTENVSYCHLSSIKTTWTGLGSMAYLHHTLTAERSECTAGNSRCKHYLIGLHGSWNLHIAWRSNR